MYTAQNPIAILAAVKDAIRTPFAFPGGYAKAIYLADGARLCSGCAREEWKQVCDETLGGTNYGWRAMGVDVHWEGPAEHCSHCGKELPSEYGNPNLGTGESLDFAIDTALSWEGTFPDYHEGDYLVFFTSENGTPRVVLVSDRYVGARDKEDASGIALDACNERYDTDHTVNRVKAYSE